MQVTTFMSVAWFVVLRVALAAQTAAVEDHVIGKQFMLSDTGVFVRAAGGRNEANAMKSNHAGSPSRTASNTSKTYLMESISPKERQVSFAQVATNESQGAGGSVVEK